MPGTPAQRMRQSAQKIDGAIARSRSAEAEKRKKKQEEDGKSMLPPWVVYLLLFLVFGGSIVQIYFSILNSPSMSTAK
jgi:hypothetical protein